MISGLRIAIRATVPALLLATPVAWAGNITTYHYDNLRTGWDQTETSLTPATVASSAFGLLSQTKLDEQVDAQPLFVAGVTIGGAAHDVVYVATEKNSIYAIDANTGAVLLSQNFGTPVPISALPGSCNNNSNNVGINSTPVIDTATQTIYAITYTYENKQQIYRIHAVSLTTLQDLVTPVVISATAKQVGGTTLTFSASVQRQRPALVETSANVYAGFGSFCDSAANQSHGWVLGWARNTLKPLPVGELIDTYATSPDNFLLSSIWMSGYGIAYDGKSLFFSTSNSDPDGKTYNKKNNLEESMIGLATNLKAVQSYFTAPNYATLDQLDEDFGGGGVLLLPTQAGPVPNMAVIAGKSSSLYLLNREKAGGSMGKSVATLGTYAGHGCWCGQSYYTGSDGVGRVVASTGGSVTVYKVSTSPSPALVQESAGPNLPYGQDPGFLTSISSNGTVANSAVIWALPHPNSTNLTLYAMDPANGSAQLYSATSGSWPFYANATANLVPVVANGHVFVASYQSLAIFGLSDPGKHVAFQPAATPSLDIGAKHEIRGVVLATEGDAMQIRTASGAVLNVDFAPGRRAGTAVTPRIGHAVQVRGDYDNTGQLVAKSVLHAINKPWLWGPDH